MKVVFDQEADTLTVILSNAPIAATDEEEEGFVLDFDADGNLVSVEILDASRRVEHPNRMEYQVLP